MQQQVSQSVVEVGCFQNGADFFLEAEAVVEAVRRHVVMLLYDTFANVISAASIPCQETSGKEEEGRHIEGSCCCCYSRRGCPLL